MRIDSLQLLRRRAFYRALFARHTHTPLQDLIETAVRAFDDPNLVAGRGGSDGGSTVMMTGRPPPFALGR